MKIKSLILASSILMASTAFAATHTATEKSNTGESIKFVIDNSSAVPNIGFSGYSFGVFAYNDLINTFSGDNADNNNIDTFSPNQDGPYPGQSMTDGKLGVIVGLSHGIDGYSDVCHVSLNTILVSDSEKGPIDFIAKGDAPTVKSESKKYTCAAHLDGSQTVLIDVTPNL